MPSLRPVVVPPPRPVRKTRTPFNTPPKVIAVPSEPFDPYEPDDYSPLKNPPLTNPTELGILSEVAASAANNNDDEISDDDTGSKSSHRVAGQKGSLCSEHLDDDNESKDPTTIDDSKDRSYHQPDLCDDDLFYSDDEELDAAFERGLDEVARAIEYSDPKKVNHGRRRTTLIAGGPLPPDYTGMNAVEKDMAKKEYEKKRKAYADKTRRTRLKGSVDIHVLAKNQYTGCVHPTLRPMSDVEANRLEVGHTFPDVHVLQLRIAEEANLRGISFQTTRSEIRQLRCYGFCFVVEANNRESEQGFIVTVCSVRPGDDYSNIPPAAARFNIPLDRYFTPFKTVMLVPLILGLIADNPGCTNKTLRGFLKPYGKAYALTESVLQESRTAARNQLFSSADINVMYHRSVCDEN